MATITHPFDPEMLYQLDEDGNIRLSKGNSTGIFTKQGNHISGDIRQADPQLCVWVGNVPDPTKVIPRPGKSKLIADTKRR